MFNIFRLFKKETFFSSAVDNKIDVIDFGKRYWGHNYQIDRQGEKFTETEFTIWYTSMASYTHPDDIANYGRVVKGAIMVIPLNAEDNTRGYAFYRLTEVRNCVDPSDMYFVKGTRIRDTSEMTENEVKFLEYRIKESLKKE